MVECENKNSLGNGEHILDIFEMYSSLFLRNCLFLEQRECYRYSVEWLKNIGTTLRPNQQ